MGNVILYAVLGTGSLLVVLTIVGALYRLFKVKWTLIGGAMGFASLLGVCVIFLTLLGIDLGLRYAIYEGCLIRRATPESANLLIAGAFLPYSLIALGVYLWHLNSHAYAHAKEKTGKHLGSSIRDTFAFYRREPLILITQATVLSAIHIALNALIVSLLLLQPLQGLAFGTTRYDKFHAFTYADGCVPYKSEFRKF